MTADEICRVYPLLEHELREWVLPSLGRELSLEKVRERLAAKITYRSDLTIALPKLSGEFLDRLEGLAVDLPLWRMLDKNQALTVANLMPASAFPDTAGELEAFVAVAEAVIVPARLPEETCRERLTKLLRPGYGNWRRLRATWIKTAGLDPDDMGDLKALAKAGTINLHTQSFNADILEVLGTRSRMLAEQDVGEFDVVTPRREPDGQSGDGSNAPRQARSPDEIRVYTDIAPLCGLQGVAVTSNRLGSRPEAREIQALFLLPRGGIGTFSDEWLEGGDRKLFAMLEGYVQARNASPGFINTPCAWTLLSPRHISPEGIHLDTHGAGSHAKVPPAVIDEAYARARLPESVKSAILALRGIRQQELKLDFGKLLGDGEGNRRLRQFVIANPLLGEVIVDDKEMTDAFMAGDSPLAVLRRVSPKMTQAHLRRLAGVSGYEIGSVSVKGIPCHENSRVLLQFFADVSPNWAPEPGGWNHLLRVAALVLSIEKVMPSLRREDLLKGCEGRWPQFIARICAAGNLTPEQFDTSPDLWRRTLDLIDPMRTLCDDLVAPLIARDLDDPDDSKAKTARDQAARILYGGKSLPKIFETSARWHARLDAIRAGMPGGGTGGWTPLCAPVQFGDVEIRPLAHKNQVAAEGSRAPDANGVPGMEHCVAGRTHDYERGMLHLCSVRRLTPAGIRPYQRLSTAEFTYHGPRGEGHLLKLTEHRAAGNVAPCEDSTAAVEAFVTGIADGSITVTPGLETRETVEGKFAGHTAYDWNDDALVEQALRAWEICLPRRLRGLTLDEFPLTAEELERPWSPEQDASEAPRPMM